MKRWLPAIVFAYFTLCFALHPQSPLATHHLADPDDYMRLDQVASWLQGQSWYDLSVPRLSPGAETTVHWSRLIDLPIAVLSVPFSHFFGLTNALLIASFVVPLLWFAGLLLLLKLWERSSTGKENGLICVFVLFMPALLFNYTPGRVDHHGVQTLIAGFGLYALGRIIRDDKGQLFAILSALFFACGFWIGAEALPWCILFIACLAITSPWHKNIVARNAAVFGACLPLFTTLIIPIALPASGFYSLALSWFSPAYAIFAALAGAVLIAGWAFGRMTSSKYLRTFFTVLCGIGAACAFFLIIPHAAQGPFANYDTFDATLALDNINEATPLIQAMHINPYMLVSVIPVTLLCGRILLLPLIGFTACFFAARRASKAERIVWLTHSAFLGAAIALTLFWQNRVSIFMEMFALVPLVWLQYTWWDALRWRLWERRLFWAEVGSFCVLTFLPVLLIPAVATHASFYPDLMLFPAARAAATCPLEPILDMLNDPESLGGKPHIIMNVSDTGPELLFKTKDSVVSGNFDVPGNADAYTFFHSNNDAPARAVAAKWNVDLVLLCRQAPTLYVGKDYYTLSHSRLRPGKDALLHLVNTDPDQPLIEKLIQGDIPVWLKEIEIPGGSDYLLFEIKKPVEKK